MVPRTFIHRICWSKFLFRSVRIHPCIYLPGPFGKRDEFLAHTVCANLSRICFFAPADGALVFLRRNQTEIPAFCVGHRTFEVRIFPGSDVDASVGSRKCAGVELSLLEPLGRSVLLFIVPVIAAGLRAAISRPVIVLRGHIVAHRHGNSCRVLVAEA